MNTLFGLGMPGGWEWIIIGLIVVIFFGANKIPEIFKGFGKGIREFKDASREIKKEIEKESDSSAEKKQPIQIARKTTLQIYSLGPFFQLFLLLPQGYNRLSLPRVQGEKIHVHGQRFDAKDLCKKITGEELNFKYFMKYAQEKYSNIYKLKN